ncbi:Eclosion hormone [Popillia japonica]|uniref:Eclosion hormone n=1 Tax=Popillia japonica TaxID=7064 RepID=A0AAW1JIX5_POPJA
MEKLGLYFCYLIFLLLYIDFCVASIPVCITNCVQCKQMFGVYFEGRACGDACISSNGQISPDCNNPGTLGIFLKRFH